MIRSKSAVAAVAVACLAVPLSMFASPALAATKTESLSASKVVIFSERDDENGENEQESDHHEGHHQIPPVIIRPHEGGHDDANNEDSEDSDDDESEADDDNGGFVLPGPGVDPVPVPMPGNDPSSAPLVPTDPTGASVNTTGYSVTPVSGAGIDSVDLNQQPGVEARNLNPEAAPPAQIQQVRGPQRTPADVFIESATVGLLAVGSGALALGGVAGVRAIKLRRNPKGDYFYDNN
ncbi:MAG: hypothetical protein RIS80_426 [Actinomycetota bacterium]